MEFHHILLLLDFEVKCVVYGKTQFTFLVELTSRWFAIKPSNGYNGWFIACNLCPLLCVCVSKTSTIVCCCVGLSQAAERRTGNHSARQNTYVLNPSERCSVVNFPAVSISTTLMSSVLRKGVLSWTYPLSVFPPPHWTAWCPQSFRKVFRRELPCCQYLHHLTELIVQSLCMSLVCLFACVFHVRIIRILLLLSTVMLEN